MSNYLSIHRGKKNTPVLTEKCINPKKPAWTKMTKHDEPFCVAYLAQNRSPAAVLSLCPCNKGQIKCIPLCPRPPQNYYKQTNEPHSCTGWHVPSLWWTWALKFIFTQSHSAGSLNDCTKCLLICCQKKDQQTHHTLVSNIKTEVHCGLRKLFCLL